MLVLDKFIYCVYADVKHKGQEVSVEKHSLAIKGLNEKRTRHGVLFWLVFKTIHFCLSLCLICSCVSKGIKSAYNFSSSFGLVISSSAIKFKILNNF